VVEEGADSESARFFVGGGVFGCEKNLNCETSNFKLEILLCQYCRTGSLNL